jgi:hypothetical protein
MVIGPSGHVIASLASADGDPSAGLPAGLAPGDDGSAEPDPPPVHAATISVVAISIDRRRTPVLPASIAFANVIIV